MKFLKNYEPKVTSNYGNRTYKINGQEVSDFHKGIDVVAKLENNQSGLDYIIAPYDCGISWCGYDDSYGYSMVIYIGKFNGKNYEMRFAHLKQGSIPSKIKTGANGIKKSEVLGYMGATGNVSGAHTHIEVIVDGETIDPTNYVIGSAMDDLVNQSILPKPVKRNDKVDQFEVLYDDTCRVRNIYAINDNNIIGIAKKGFYNVVSKKLNTNGYDWFEVEKGKWIAQVKDVSQFLPKYEEPKNDQNKPNTDTNYQDNINRLENELNLLKQELDSKNKELELMQQENDKLNKEITYYKDLNDTFREFIAPTNDNYYIKLEENQKLTYKKD